MKKEIDVDEKLIVKIAKLAKLQFDAKGTEKIKSDLERMLLFVDAISKIDTDHIDPLIYMSKETNILRGDEINLEISQSDALKNAPQKDSDYFKVPTVLKKSLT